MKLNYKKLIEVIKKKAEDFKNNIIRKTDEYNNVFNLYKRVLSENSNLKYNLKKKEEQFEELSKKVSEITEKMAKVKVETYYWSGNSGSKKYRVCVDLDMYHIQEFLIHGNDKKFIDYMGMDIGRQVAQEIKQINYVRY